MCEPVTIGLATVAIVGATISAVGQAKQAKYENAIAERNAQNQEQAAALALQRGAITEGAIRMKGSQEVGKARTEIATSGVDLSSGTPLEVIGDARMLSEFDAQVAKNNAAREAWGYQVGAANSIAAGDLALQRGRYAVASTLLTGAAQAGSMLYAGLKPLPVTGQTGPVGSLG